MAEDKNEHTPKIETSTWPPRIIPNDSELSNVEAPGTSVTVSLPALIISLLQVSQIEPRLHREDQNLRIYLALGRIRPHAQYTILTLHPDRATLGQE